MTKYILLFIIIVYIGILLHQQFMTSYNYQGGGEMNLKCAFVTLMFGGDSYLEGVLTLAYSIKKTNTEHDIVCMVTDDVSEDAKNKMRMIGIKVVIVPYLEFKTFNEEKRNQSKLLKRYPLISKFYTKWNILNLTEYDKVLFLDADMLVIKSIDHLFSDEIKLPASRFNTGFPKFNELINRHGCDGVSFPPSLFDKILKSDTSWTIDGGLVLLRPDENHFNEYKTMMENSPYVGMGGPDEYSLLKYMSLYENGPKMTWTNLSDAYSCIEWHPNRRCNIDDSFILNFYGTTKPWDKKNTYEESLIWRVMNAELYSVYPSLQSNRVGIYTSRRRERKSKDSVHKNY